MPKYYPFLVAGHYLYFTSKCIVEAMHVHASDKKLSEGNSAKFFVYADGSTKVQQEGDLSDIQIKTVQRFIRENYLEMYEMWRLFGGGDFYTKP